MAFFASHIVMGRALKVRARALKVRARALKVGLGPGPGLSPSLKVGPRAGPGLGPLPTNTKKNFFSEIH